MCERASERGREAGEKRYTACSQIDWVSLSFDRPTGRWQTSEDRGGINEARQTLPAWVAIDRSVLDDIGPELRSGNFPLTEHIVCWLQSTYFAAPLCSSRSAQLASWRDAHGQNTRTEQKGQTEGRPTKLRCMQFRRHALVEIYRAGKIAWMRQGERDTAANDLPKRLPALTLACSSEREIYTSCCRLRTQPCSS